MESMPHHGVHNVDPKTLSRFIMEQSNKQSPAGGGNGRNADLAVIINGIAVASKVIANAVTVSGIQSLHTLHGQANTTGDEQKTLDMIANEVMINVLQATHKVGVMVSEENPNIITCAPQRSTPGGTGTVAAGSSGKQYAVVFDPLDGSSNIECSVSTGTIFGIYECATATATASPGIMDVLQPGKNLVCAGYVLYSSSVVMVLSLGIDQGVRSFTIDPTFGEFVETAASPVAIPAKPKRIISVNAGNSEIWNLPTSEFVRWTKRQKERYSLRYIGSMVADVHRTLLYGGIFMYPADFFSRSGKLRLLYECFPMAFLVEAAGGMASTGTQRILDVVPADIHQRCPIYLGCKRDVAKVEEMFRAIPCLYSMHDAPQSAAPRHRRRRRGSSGKGKRSAGRSLSRGSTTATTATTARSKRVQRTGAEGLLNLFCVPKWELTEDYVGKDSFEHHGKKGSRYQDTVQMSDAKWTLATACDTGHRGLVPTKLLTPATANQDASTHPAKVPRTLAAARGLLSATGTARELCEIELTTYTVERSYSGDDALFQLSLPKGARVKDVERMADSRWSMATDCASGGRGLLPSHLLSPTGQLVDHKVARAAFQGESEFEVDFAQGDSATNFRLMSDTRWCSVENTRTREAGVVPTSIFA